MMEGGEGDFAPDRTPRLFDIASVDHELTIADRFTMVPFSFLDTRKEDWRSRKRMWLETGLQSELGRDARTFGDGGGTDEVTQKILAVSDGISIFDPVLCEMAYRWFSPVGGHILDPFAGGSVRGICAGVTRRHYTGIDLSSRQVAANRQQVPLFLGNGLIKGGYEPTWIESDSALMDFVLPDNYKADFVWSCPPYFDLEKYSDDPSDLSNMPWQDFLVAYRSIIEASVNRLRNHRFAGFVVGEIRDGKGMYRNFVGETIRAFEDAGARYYNEAILVNMVGTLALRVGKQFDATRKIGRTHQTVLLFVKGDPKLAAIACGEAMMGDTEAAAVELDPDTADMVAS